MSQADKKKKFIRAWYLKECTKLTFSDRLALARIWIEICLKDEEYEMASAIQKARQEIVKAHIKHKRSNRTFSQKFVVSLYLMRRKIKSWLKK